MRLQISPLFKRLITLCTLVKVWVFAVHVFHVFYVAGFGFHQPAAVGTLILVDVVVHARYMLLCGTKYIESRKKS